MQVQDQITHVCCTEMVGWNDLRLFGYHAPFARVYHRIASKWVVKASKVDRRKITFVCLDLHKIFATLNFNLPCPVCIHHNYSVISSRSTLIYTQIWEIKEQRPAIRSEAVGSIISPCEAIWKQWSPTSEIYLKKEKMIGAIICLCLGNSEICCDNQTLWVSLSQRLRLRCISAFKILL